MESIAITSPWCEAVLYLPDPPFLFGGGSGNETNAHTNHFSLSAAPGDYGVLNNFHLGPFNNDVHQLSFNISVVDDNISDDNEMFSTSLTLVPADQARLGNRVTVTRDVVTVTIKDNDGT